MGKSDNIKRAKKLKEAKRQREKDALIAAGIITPSKTFTKKIVAKGTLVLQNTSDLKFSELLRIFAYPILKDDDDMDLLRSKLFFATQAWNMAVIRDKSEKEYHSHRKTFIGTFKDIEGIEEMLDELLKRKQDEFTEFKVLFADFELRLSKNKECTLNVTVSICT